jgi:hypothetical protein
MDRTYLAIAASAVRDASDNALFGELSRKLSFALEPTQAAAWEYQIKHLRSSPSRYLTRTSAWNF